MGVEDALVLAEALDTTTARVREGSIASKASAVTSAFQAFSATRLERSQWLVRSSREMGEIYQWRYAETGRDSEKIKAEFKRRSRIIWDFDVDEMVAEARKECASQMEKNCV